MTTDEQTDERPGLLPAPECDILMGYGAIAAWFGITKGQAIARVRDGIIPIHKVRGKSTVYMSKAEAVAAIKKRW